VDRVHCRVPETHPVVTLVRPVPSIDVTTRRIDVTPYLLPFFGRQALQSLAGTGSMVRDRLQLISLPDRGRLAKIWLAGVAINSLQFVPPHERAP